MTRDEAKEYIKNNPNIYFKQYLSRYERKKSFPLCPKNVVNMRYSLILRKKVITSVLDHATHTVMFFSL